MLNLNKPTNPIKEIQQMLNTSNKVDTRIITVTPQMAQAILNHHAPNRPVSHHSVGKYASDMTSGRWVYNGQNIIFDDDGYLIDGQHRLRAVIQSGASVRMGVTMGISRNTFDTIDTGRVRSNSDLMGMLGSKDNRMAALIVKGGYLLDNKSSLTTIVGRHEIVSYYETWQPQIDRVAEYAQKHFKRGLIPASSLAIVMFMATRHGVYSFEPFVEGVLSGESLVAGDPRHSLREWAINSKIRNGRINPTSALWAVIRAWQVWVANETISVLRTPRDSIGWVNNFIPGQEVG